MSTLTLSRSASMMEAFEAATQEPRNPAVEGRLLGSTRLHLIPYDDTAVVLKLISTHDSQRRTGKGSEALRFLCDLADRNRVTLYLHALPQSTGYLFARKLRNAELVAWYERHGFEAESQSANSHFEASPKAGLNMLQRPRKP